jgi:ABC-type dipeptide/oligopeptide/nickel transport system permease subunit
VVRRTVPAVVVSASSPGSVPGVSVATPVLTRAPLSLLFLLQVVVVRFVPSEAFNFALIIVDVGVPCNIRYIRSRKILILSNDFYWLFKWMGVTHYRYIYKSFIDNN